MTLSARAMPEVSREAVDALRQRLKQSCCLSEVRSVVEEVG